MASGIKAVFADCDDNDVSDDQDVTEILHTAVRLSYKRSSSKTQRSMESSKHSALSANRDVEDNYVRYVSTGSQHLDAALGRTSIATKLYEAEKRRTEMKRKLDRSRREIMALEQQQETVVHQASTGISTVSLSSHYDFNSTVVSSTTNCPRRCFFPTETRNPSVRTDEWINHLTTHDPCSSSSYPTSRPEEDKPFNGDPKEWHVFADRFKTEVHDVVPDDTLRLLYLRDRLAPEIRQTCTKSTYPHFLKQLQNAYGHPVLVVRACIEALKQILPVMNDDDVKEFAGQIHATIAVLTKAGCQNDLHSYSMLELSGVTAKLQPTLQMEWKKWAENVIRTEKIPVLPNLALLASWLDQLSTK